MGRRYLWGVAAVICVAMVAAVGCGDGGSYKYEAQGAPYEIVVVADHEVWDGAVGDTLRATFYRQFPMINRQETTFDLLRVLPSGFTKLTTRHRNVMIVRIDPTLPEAMLSMAGDVYARPQTVITAEAPDEASLLRLVDDNRENIVLLLENAEKDRDVAAAATHTPKEIAAIIKEKFDFEMGMGPGYKVRSEGENFLWLSYEMPTSSQGIIIYTYPFSGVSDFELESLLSRRDEFVANIPGENPGSHMSTNREFTDLVFKTISGRQWAELHGFWDVEGDFMGGPCTNYSTFDGARQRVVAIDFYVYSPDPRLSQRNYIRQLEHFIYTVKISGEAPRWEE